MKGKQLLGSALLALGVIGLVVAGQRVAKRATAPSSQQETAVPGEPEKSCHAVVYYLHSNEHCATCDRIQALTKKTMAEDFAGEIASGLLDFRIRNVDEPEHEHYWDEFQMDAATVVVQAQGPERRFENLSKVWMLYRDETAFREYLRQQIRAFLPKAAVQRDGK
ncbi:MAG: hypothetical protein CSA62_13285 [Planctomycetota bacterium]|nr:MAG: hypothetical protein CSA62_13285 [Planctomycetota bacterium]